MPEIIDLSQPLDDVAFDAEPRVGRVSHQRGATLLGWLSVLGRGPGATLLNALRYALGTRRLTAACFPQGLGLAWENFKGDTHTGTHLDAPYHFGPQVGPHPARTIDEIPLDWCYADGVALDMRTCGAVMGVGDLESALEGLGYSLRPLDIVLLCTGASPPWESREYPNCHKALAPEAIRWLAGKGVKIIVVDAFTIDRPFQDMYADYFRDGDARHLWPSHFVGRMVETCHVENAANLESLLARPTGFKVCCFPVKIRRGSAGWVRLVAVYPTPGLA